MMLYDFYLIEKMYVWYKNLWLNKYANIKHMHIRIGMPYNKKCYHADQIITT